MDEESPPLWDLMNAAIFLSVTPFFIELIHTFFFRSFRTSLAPSVQYVTSTPSSEISLSPADTHSPNPTEGGVNNFFISNL